MTMPSRNGGLGTGWLWHDHMVQTWVVMARLAVEGRTRKGHAHNDGLDKTELHGIVWPLNALKLGPKVPR